MMFIPHSKHTEGPSRPVTRIVLLFYMWMIFVPHSKHFHFTLLLLLALVLTAESEGMGELMDFLNEFQGN
jgi:hypothetical protein